VIEVPAPVVPISQLRRRKVDRALARRIDRLSRRAHRFHRFAHHPLCGAYVGEVIRYRRIRVCRGCAFAILGGLAGGATALATGGSLIGSVIGSALGTGVLLATLWAKTRIAKRWTRLVPAAAFAYAISSGVLTWQTGGYLLAVLAGALVATARVLYGRRGADRSACASCPERNLAPCSGMAAIVSRERAFQRVAARWLDEGQAQIRR
jgi:hypothetical protein